MGPHPVINLNSPKTMDEFLTESDSYGFKKRRHRIWPSSSSLQRLLDSFKPDETNADFFPSDYLSQVNSGSTTPRPDPSYYYYDLHLAAVDSANTGLARKLKGRHLQMIAIGGSIGAGLFVASGESMYTAGPASVLIGFSTVGVILFCTCQALGELAVSFPIVGSFSSWATRFMDPSWGFAIGWQYALQWLIILPLELIAGSLTIKYWNQQLPRAIFTTIFLGIVVVINLFGVKGYGEAEFAFSLVKVIAIIGFILLGVVLNCGGTPDRGYIGGEYWRDPGAFNNGLKGLSGVLVTACFAFGGTELIGLAAAETANPRKSLPTAIKQVFWRIALFYIIALTLVGLLVPYNNPRLNSASNRADANASPFVIAIEEAGIQVLPSVMNFVILVSVMSVANSAIFGSSRTLVALAKLHQAPKLLGYVDRRGRPLVAIATAAALGLLAYLGDLKQQNKILEWLLAISGLSFVFTWTSICICHIRFRSAWAYHGRSLNSIPSPSQLGVIGSYIGLTLNIVVLIAQFWVSAFPIGWETMTPSYITQNFFLNYLGVPIFFLFYISHKLVYKTSYVKICEMDVDTGRKDFNLPILKAQELDERASWPIWKKVYKFLC